MTTTTESLLSPYRLGALDLPNRVVMAPMTRYRAAEDGTPLPLVAEYYAQRASAGLIVTEGIWPSREGQSGWRLPGLETPAHVAGWRAVTEAVHAAGGRIVAQLMHGGRQRHPLNRLLGDIPAGPSAVPAPGPVHVRDGAKAEAVTPRELTRADIQSATRPGPARPDCPPPRSRSPPPTCSPGTASAANPRWGTASPPNRRPWSWPGRPPADHPPGGLTQGTPLLTDCQCHPLGSAPNIHTTPVRISTSAPSSPTRRRHQGGP